MENSNTSKGVMGTYKGGPGPANKAMKKAKKTKKNYTPSDIVCSDTFVAPSVQVTAGETSILNEIENMGYINKADYKKSLAVSSPIGVTNWEMSTGSKCECGDITCTIKKPIMPAIGPFKYNVAKTDNLLEQFSKKDLIGAIHALLEESGGTGVKIPKAGATFLHKDIIVQSNTDGLPYIAFRSLVDAAEESEQG